MSMKNCVLLLMWSIHLLGITRGFQGFTMWNVTEYLLDGHKVSEKRVNMKIRKEKIENVEEEGGVEETKGDTEDGIHS